MNSHFGRLVAFCVMGGAVVLGQDASVLLRRMQSALGGRRIFQVRDIDWEVKASPKFHLPIGTI